MDCVCYTADQGLNATQNPQYVLTQISERSPVLEVAKRLC